MDSLGCTSAEAESVSCNVATLWDVAGSRRPALLVLSSVPRNGTAPCRKRVAVAMRAPLAVIARQRALPLRLRSHSMVDGWKSAVHAGGDHSPRTHILCTPSGTHAAASILICLRSSSRCEGSVRCELRQSGTIRFESRRNTRGSCESTWVLSAVLCAPFTIFARSRATSAFGLRLRSMKSTLPR